MYASSIHVIFGFIGKTVEEFQVGKNGKAYVKFSVSEPRQFNGQESVEWHQVTVFGPQAEALVRQKRIQKGFRVAVRGYQKTSRWQNNAGVEKLSVEVIADEVVSAPKLLFSKKALDAADAAAQIDREIGDDEVPF